MATLLIVVAALALIGFLIWYFFLRTPGQGDVIRLPLQDLGLMDIPAVPFSVEAAGEAALSLRDRTQETNQAMNGLQRMFTIQGETANARSFLFGQADQDDRVSAHEEVIDEMERSLTVEFKNPVKVRARLARSAGADQAPAGGLTRLFLTQPEDFSLSWTRWAGVYDAARHLLPEYAKTLELSDEGAAAASAAFWPHIAENGQAFNLLLPQKLGQAEPGHPQAGKTLYRIDLSLFENFEPTSTDGFVRFTPGTVIELYQDPQSLNLVPYQIEVRGYRGSPTETFIFGEAKPGMWLYALQAAKTAVTTWGIWLGHVHHWHIVTAALQFTLFTTEGLTPDHAVRRLLDPMSKYLIGFDDFLLLAFERIAPPTSFKSALDFLELQNFAARACDFHDDDPIPTLQRLNLQEDDFTSPGGEAWDKYPIVGRLLELWDATETYVRGYVDEYWKSDDAVIADGPLRAWVLASGNPDGGNLKGLPALDGPGARDALIRLLTSYLYRITAHGSSRLNSAANPVLSFVANFPPCLQSHEIHAPDYPLTSDELLRFLPNTGSIGSMMNFLFIFVFSAPYESFIPAKGIDQELFFPGGKAAPLNEALIAYRSKVETVLRHTSPENPQIHQWPRSIET
jgi:hypothetical protein